MDNLITFSKKTAPIWGILAALVLAACGPSAPAESPTSLPVVETPAALASALATSSPPPPDLPAEEIDPAQAAYPPPTQIVVTESYPAGGKPPTPVPTPVPEGYPAAVEEVFLEPRFRIDQPLAVGATVVEGQALPGVTIAVMDVTFGGALLGTGVTDEVGRFSINVPPLEAGNRIGITIGELESGQTLNEMAEKFFPHRGEGFMNLPNIGILFDTVQVQP